MTPAIRIGPLVFPSDLLVLIVAAAVGLLAARLLTRRQQSRPDTGTVLWRALIIGLVVARLGFVWQFQDHFIENPLRILDLRDGGWAGMAVIVTSGLVATVLRARTLPNTPAEER